MLSVSNFRAGVFFALLVLHGVRGQYLLQMSVYSYSNPDSQCIECRDSPTAELGCCDNHPVTNPDDCDASSRQCDIFLTFCPRRLNNTTRGSQCPQNSPTTYSTSTDFNVREYTFDPVLLIFLTVFSGWNGIQVYVMMNDDDFGSPREVELVDSLAINLTFPVGTVTDRTTYNGQFGLAQIDLSFNLTCLENYFGPDCSQFCDKSISNCSCGPGFTGEFCQTNIDDCARLSVNCSGRGRCVDGISSFSCECEPGYSGTECEGEIDECVEESVVCGLNMHCEDGLNNYTCVCDSGFTGLSCNQAMASPSSAGAVAGGLVGGLIVLALLIIIVVVVILLYIKTHRKNIEINRSRTDSHGYDVVGPTTRGVATTTQGTARDRAQSEHTYETVPATARPNINVVANVSYETPGTSNGQASSTSYNDREFVNPIYGEDEAHLPGVQQQLDNPTYGLNEEDDHAVATETERNLAERDMPYETPAYEYVPN